MARDITHEVEEAIRTWAAPDEDLGWAGSPEVATHAQEIAGWLSDQALLRAES